MKAEQVERDAFCMHPTGCVERATRFEEDPNYWHDWIGAGFSFCDVCERVYTWGCGHSGAQEAAARRHNATQKHARRECRCYGHDHCDVKTCKLARIRIAGYMPFYQHTEASS